MTSTQQQAPFTWIITGASRGFGRSIAEAALDRGDNVVAAVRRVGALDDLGAKYRDRLTVVPFDASSTEGVPDVVSATTQRFGRVDVLVNNAGRGYIGAAEEVGEDDLREAMELHFFVPAALVRQVLPVMRAQRSGTIVQMSSQGGRMSFPGAGTYSAGKFALEGWSEALSGEVAGFGIRTLIVEPSRFRTGFNASDVLALSEVDETYRDVLDAVRKDMQAADGVQEGDPDKAAEILVDLAHSDTVPLRLPLGAEAVERISTAYRSGLAAVDDWADVARSADYADAVAASRPI